MSSMIIPIAPSGAGSGGGGNYILIFADLPQYIAGKYIVVELSGTEIYAATVPNDVQSVTVSITEAGTYTVKVYASSSSSSPSETHTVNVTTLTANYGVHIGTGAFFNETSPSSTITYYTPANSGTLYTSSTYTASSVSATSQTLSTLKGTYTAAKSGIVRIKFSGSISRTDTNTASLRVFIYIGTSGSGGTYDSPVTINALTSSGITTLNGSYDFSVKEGETYTIITDVYFSSTTSSATMNFSNVEYYIYGSSTTLSTETKMKSYSKAIKSVQSGTIGGRGSSYSSSAILPSCATITPVDTTKAIFIGWYGSSSGGYSMAFDGYLIAPNVVRGIVRETLKFMIIEYY